MNNPEETFAKGVECREAGNEAFKKGNNQEGKLDFSLFLKQLCNT